MNKIALAASSAAVLLMAGGAANADWYLKLGAGPTWTPKLNVTAINQLTGGIFGSGKLGTGVGYNGDVGVGTDLGFWDMPDWVVEMNAVYTHNTFEHIDACDVDFEGPNGAINPEFCDFEISKLALEWDLTYHIQTGTGFVPYLGGGVEARDTIFHNGTEVQDPAFLNSVILPAGEFSHWNVVGHAIVGVDWNFDPLWTLFAEYRYEIRSSGKLTNGVLGTDAFTHMEYQSHNLIAGIKIHMGD